jgi:branched-chain amino acid transport system permease protein
MYHVAGTVDDEMSPVSDGVVSRLFVGATFASIQYSILPLLWVLLGGAGTVLGPLVGTALMFYLVDIGSSATDAHLLVVGVALLALVLFARKGLLGSLRARAVPWLP